MHQDISLRTLVWLASCLVILLLNNRTKTFTCIYLFILFIHVQHLYSALFTNICALMRYIVDISLTNGYCTFCRRSEVSLKLSNFVWKMLTIYRPTVVSNYVTQADFIPVDGFTQIHDYGTKCFFRVLQHQPVTLNISIQIFVQYVGTCRYDWVSN